MSTSREEFLKQLYTCVKHQPDDIEPGPTITGPAEIFDPGQYVAPEEIGNGEVVVMERESTYMLPPPGEAGPSIVMGIEDWA